MIERIRILTAVACCLQFAVAAGQAPGPQLPSFVSDQVVVAFQPGTPGSEIANAHRQAGGAALRSIDAIGAVVVQVPQGNVPAAVAAYEGNPNVLYAEPNYLRPVVLPNEGSDPQPPFGLGIDYFDEQYGLHNTGQSFFYDQLTGAPGAVTGVADADIDAPEAWDLNTGSSNIVVAVLDSGVDCLHVDLVNKCIEEVNFGPSNTLADQIGHGTHVAGIIAAEGNNGKGVAGVSWNASLAALKVCYEYYDIFYGLIGLCDSAASADAMTYAADQGYHVINMSYAGPSGSQAEAAAAAYAWQHGVVLVAAAANAYSSTPMYPAAFNEVIAVAASDWYDNLAGFSNFGPSWVSLAAPGHNTFSTMPNAACGLQANDPDGCYGWLSGTSMASPTVAGAAALVWSHLGGSATNTAVRDALEDNADTVGALGQNMLAWTANGRLNLHAALQNAGGGGGGEEPAAAGGAHIGDLDGTSSSSGPNWSADITVLVHDESHMPVANALVTGNWSNGVAAPSSCTTSANGRCMLSTGSMPKRTGSVSYTVGSVNAQGLNYSAADNHDPDGGNGSSITVSK